MAKDRVVVRNAADPQQVRRAERLEEQHAELVTGCLQAVLATAEGRVLLWDLLTRAGVFRSVWSDSGSRTYYNAGRQDFGHELLALYLAADPDLYQVMEREARSRAAITDRTTDALQARRDAVGESPNVS